MPRKLDVPRQLRHQKKAGEKLTSRWHVLTRALKTAFYNGAKTTRISPSLEILHLAVIRRKLHSEWSFMTATVFVEDILIAGRASHPRLKDASCVLIRTSRPCMTDLTVGTNKTNDRMSER